MKCTDTAIPGVVIIEPDVFGDNRGFFMETWRQERYTKIGIKGPFVQDNLSFSTKGVLRGLHYQHPHAQGKLVSVVQGEVFDVAVDIRYGSPTFGKWVGVTLSGDNHKQFWVPQGFAHGFCVLSETAYFTYKCTDIYASSAEGGIAWNDSDIEIEWPITANSFSEKDMAYPHLKNVPIDRLPKFVETEQMKV